MRILFLSISVLLLFTCSTFGQLPLAKVKDPVVVPFDRKDLEWLKHGGTMAITILVDKKGKPTVMDVMGPMLPCEDLTSPHIDSLRKAAAKAAEKSTYEPPVDREGKPLDSGVKLTLNIPAADSSSGPDIVSHTGLKLIDVDVVNGRAVHIERPEFPLFSRALGSQGKVRVEVIIDENGKVADAETIYGDPRLRANSEDAACRSKFTPTLADGKPVRVRGVIVYDFIM